MNVRAAIAAADPALVAACEQRIVNAWPAPSTLLIGDWVIRMANGYSGRANSASPLRDGADLDDATLDLVEGLYRAEGLAPCVRLTPLATPPLRGRLLARGYSVKDASFGMVATTRPFASAGVDGLSIASRPGDAWLDAISRFQIPSKRNPAHLGAIVRNIRLPAAFATLAHDGGPAAFGMSVVERGMAEIGSVMVDEALRGRGLGRRLVAALMGWAAGQGAETAFLQVDQANQPAIALYRSMGYETAYAYETMIHAG